MTIVVRKALAELAVLLFSGAFLMLELGDLGTEFIRDGLLLAALILECVFAFSNILGENKHLGEVRSLHKLGIIITIPFILLLPDAIGTAIGAIVFLLSLISLVVLIAQSTLPKRGSGQRR